MVSELHVVSPVSRAEGGIFGVRADGVAGWAWNPDAPHRALEVELLLDGEPVKSACAELFDPELAERKVGNGSHSFRLLLDRIPDLPCRLGVRISGTDSSLGSVVVETREDLARVVAPSARYQGNIDELRVGRIHGWVIDRCRPNARVRVVLRDWQEPLLESTADIHRPSLEQQGKGDGRCAFAIRLPVTLLDGAPHTLRVTLDDTDCQLPGSPISFDAVKARELMEVIAPWRTDFLRIEDALSRLDQLTERLEAAHAPRALLQKLRRVFKL
jgi:hypothetical protein